MLVSAPVPAPFVRTTWPQPTTPSLGLTPEAPRCVRPLCEASRTGGPVRGYRRARGVYMALRSSTVTFRLTASEKARLEADAERAGVSAGDHARRLVLGALD